MDDSKTPPVKPSPKKRLIIKRFMPQTLLGRSLLILITPVLLIQIVATIIFFDRHWQKMTSRLALAVAGEIGVLVQQYEDGQGDKELERYAKTYFDFEMSHEQVANSNISEAKREKRWIQGWDDMITESLKNELASKIQYGFSVESDFSEKWVAVSVQVSEGDVLRFVMPQRRLFSSTSYIFLIWIFGVSILLLVIAILFMRNQIRPIRRLAIAADRFGRGGDVRHFKVEGAREVRQAGQAFLDMKTRIQRQISQRTEMLAGVSHDLKTPLTRLKLQVAMMGDSADIYDMKRDLDDMERMLEGYLSFVRGEGREKTTETDLMVLLRGIVTSAKRQGVDVEFLENENLEKVAIAIRPMAFKRCIHNILSNASKYAGRAWLRCEREENSILIIIEDDGKGIAEKEYEDVFRPFYRIDESRNTDTGGVGLGLPIAMDIIHGHGGHIWLDKSKKHGGLAVLIRMPL